MARDDDDGDEPIVLFVFFGGVAVPWGEGRKG